MNEIRHILGVEWRADPANGPGELIGAAMRFGDVANLPWGKERFEPRSIHYATGGVILNRQHDRGRPLARFPEGGLTLDMSDSALTMRARVADTTEGRDTVALVRSGVLRGLSVEFVPEKERSEGLLRIIERAKLVGIAVVDDGAYDGATVGCMVKREAERTFRLKGAPVRYREHGEWL